MSILKPFKKVETDSESPKFDLPAVKAALEFGANQYKAFRSAHDVINILENWDNASNEIKTRLDSLNSVYESTLDQVENAKADRDMVLKEVDDLRALAAADAVDIKAAAAAEGEAIKAAKLGPLELQVSSLDLAIVTLGETKDALEVEVADLTEKKASLDEYLAKVKASLA